STPAWRLMAPLTPCGNNSHQGMRLRFHALTITSTGCSSRSPCTIDTLLEVVWLVAIISLHLKINPPFHHQIVPPLVEPVEPGRPVGHSLLDGGCLLEDPRGEDLLAEIPFVELAAEDHFV